MFPEMGGLLLIRCYWFGMLSAALRSGVLMFELFITCF